MSNYTIVVHGGAGTIRREDMSERREREHRAALEAALAAGAALLEAGEGALAAVIAAVQSLEDCPLFNAGRGSTFTHSGTIEMDAAVMEGAERRAGAVAGVSRIRNPVLAADAVMRLTPHVLLAGAAADEFAEAQGLVMEPPEYFHTKHRYKQLQQALARNKVVLDHDNARMGTVGAVARDAQGRLAAATSTGGMTNKRAGRIGDSPLIGAGTWADAQVAVSCTGVGEAFIRCGAAHEVAARMRLGGETAQQAMAAVLAEVARMGGGGLIAVDAQGEPAMGFTGGGMYRGVLRQGGVAEVAIYAE